jgi:hypothetical protein
MDTRTARRETIQCAVDFLRGVDDRTAARVLKQTNVHVSLWDDREQMIQKLTDAANDDNGLRMFGGWKAAQQILEAAGIGSCCR